MSNKLLPGCLVEITHYSLNSWWKRAVMFDFIGICIEKSKINDKSVCVLTHEGELIYIDCDDLVIVNTDFCATNLEANALSTWVYAPSDCTSE